MNLKSYIRGIGIGILVTTAIFLVSGVNDKKGGMTDAQVIARAKELGLVESTTLSEINNDVTPAIEDEMIAEETHEEVVEEIVAEVEEQPAGEDTVESEIEAEETTTEAVGEAEEKKDDVEKSESEVVEDVAESDVKTEELKENAIESEEEELVADKQEDVDQVANNDSDSEDVVIVVNPGDGSDKVAKKLFDAGLVPNAYEFDQFLMANGYDRKITTGNHVISRMATGDEIGKNLVSPTK